MLIRELVTRFGFDVDQQALGTLEKNIGKITASIGVAGAAALAIPVALVRSTMETQQALGELSSIGVKDLALLDDAARKFSNRFAGTTKAQFVGAAYDVRSAISTMTDEQVAGFTAVAAMTAKATKATVQEMVGLFTTGYGIFKSQYENLSDLEFGELLSGGVSQAVQQFKTTGPAMEAAIRSLGSVSTSAGRSMAEQFALLGMLQRTAPGAEAGTILKAFEMNAAKAGKALGLTFVNATGQIRPAAEILDEIRSKFPDISQAAAQMELKEAFGSDEALKFVLNMVNDTAAIRSNVEGIEHSMSRGTETTKTMADAINKGPKASFEILGQQWQNLMEELGKPLLPGAQRVFDFLGGTEDSDGLLVQLQEFVKEHPNVSAGINALLVGFGLLASGISAVLVPVAALTIAWPTLTAGAIVFKAALLGLPAAIFKLGAAFLSVFLWPAMVAAALALIVDDVYKWATGQKSVLGKLVGDIGIEFGDKLLDALADVGEKIDAFWHGVWDGVMGIFSGAGDMLAGAARNIGGKVLGALSYIPGLSGLAGGLGDYNGGGMADPSSMRPVNGGGTSNNVTVNANVQIPEGTTPEAAQAFRDGARSFADTTASDLSRFIASGRSDFARVE